MAEDANPLSALTRPLRAADLERAARTVARAFAWREPWGAWSLPDERTRESRLRQLVGADIRDRFLPAGMCSTIAGLCVTLWIPPASASGGAPFADRRDDDAYAAFGDRGELLREGDALIERLKPAGEHWFLDTFATDPEWMRRGLGGRLLDHDLAIQDSHGRSCLLDTHTTANVGFYRSRGFELVAEGRLPGDGPDLYVMVRPPREQGGIVASPPTAD
jgi:ribosomal protein S18 acetylase RimI-like enzyme